MKNCPFLNVLRETSIGAEFCQFLLFMKFCEFLLRYCSVSTELVEVNGFYSFPLLFHSPLSNALVARNTGCPLSAKLSIMPSTVLSHSPSSLWGWVQYQFFSGPGPRNDPCPRVNLRAHSVTLRAFAIQSSLLPPFPQSMSLYFDMKLILPFNCSGSHFHSVIIF